MQIAIGSLILKADFRVAYGMLYLGRDLPTALMESVFHKHQWLADTQRSIALKEVQARMVRAVGVMDDVLLADLTAPGVMASYFGLNLEQLASRHYTHTQQRSDEHTYELQSIMHSSYAVFCLQRNNIKYNTIHKTKKSVATR